MMLAKGVDTEPYVEGYVGDYVLTVLHLPNRFGRFSGAFWIKAACRVKAAPALMEPPLTRHCCQPVGFGLVRHATPDLQAERLERIVFAITVGTQWPAIPFGQGFLVVVPIEVYPYGWT